MIYRYYQRHIFPHLLNQVMQSPALMDKRRELLHPVQGGVLEIGFGTGLNLPFYQQVDTLYALEPNADIYQLSLSRISAAPFYIKHIQASAHKLPFPDQSIEHIVCTWTLCSIQDLDTALAEIYRVLRPTGTFHLVEHVAYDQDHPKLQTLQNWLTPLQKKLADGCHLNRNIEQNLIQAGFEFRQKQYFEAEGIPKLAKRMLLARLKPRTKT